MKIKLSKEDYQKTIQLLDIKEINISIADLLFSTYSLEKYSQTDKYFEFLLQIMDVDPNDDFSIKMLSKSIEKDLKILSKQEFENNEYFKNITLKPCSFKEYKIGFEKYKSFEPFSYDDVSIDEENYFEINKIGYFKENVSYPYISYKNNIWMLITPNEINTMQKAIDEASGNVLVYGLGLGYFPYMISLKDNVKKITIIEKDKNIVNLFKKNIFPQFKNQTKFEIIISDAFDYMKLNKKYDFCFIDLWHDPNDGLPLYLKSKKFENSNCKYFYWLETSLIAMLRRCLLTLIEENFAGYTDKNYEKSENEFDKIINDLYRKTKNISFNSYEDIKSFLSKNNILELISI